jgi:hypothetical protein
MLAEGSDSLDSVHEPLKGEDLRAESCESFNLPFFSKSKYFPKSNLQRNTGLRTREDHISAFAFPEKEDLVLEYAIMHMP